jgi:hypothetical protein
MAAGVNLLRASSSGVGSAAGTAGVFYRNYEAPRFVFGIFCRYCSAPIRTSYPEIQTRLPAPRSSDAGSPISRYGVVAQGWAENIAYGQRSARVIVMALIVDDGMRGRGHRRNIFKPNYNAAGVAYGPHARYGSVCSIDFASGYAEGPFVCAGTDAANSF